MSIKSIAVLIISGLLFSSCSQKITHFNSLLRKKKLDLRELNFEYLKGKGKINYQDDSIQFSATANVRIKKDSAIWLSFSKAGIEGARGIISMDSIDFLYRPDNAYYHYDFKSLTEKFNFKVDYHLIQSMILGEPPRPLTGDETVSRQGNFFHIRKVEESVIMDYYVNVANMRIERVEMIEMPSRNTLSFNYGDFELVDEVPFATTGIVFFNYNSSEQRFTMKISFNYTKAELVDRKLKFPFNIPQKYEQK